MTTCKTRIKQNKMILYKVYIPDGSSGSRTMNKAFGADTESFKRMRTSIADIYISYRTEQKKSYKTTYKGP